MSAVALSSFASSATSKAPALKLIKAKRHDTVTYRGNGYLYHFHKSAQDLTAKLKMTRDLMELFIKRVGFVNTRGLPGLTVAEQGGGWYEVFTVNDSLSPQVLNFLRRLNRWMAQQLNPKTANEKPSHKHHYTLQVEEHVHKHIPLVRGPLTGQPATPELMRDMVSLFNAKFGKK